MMNCKRNGVVSAYVLVSMGVLLTVSLGVASLASNSLLRVRRDRNTMIAQQACFAALDHITGKAYKDLKANDGKFVYAAMDLDSTIEPLAPDVDANVWVTPTADQIAYVTARVKYRGVTSSVRNYIVAKEVGIWNNAVFAGSGASGQAINGNVDIRGSVHILGDGEPYLDLNANGKWDGAEAFTDNNGNGKWDPGEPYTDANMDGVYTVSEPFNDMNSNGLYDPPMTQTSLDASFSGTAYIGNNYSGMPAGLAAYAPPEPMVNGVKQLGTEVRVKHGLISINGTATIGTSNVVDGGTSKSTVDGMYVNDGYSGNKGASSVFSDNGTTNTYDLGNIPLQFPVISGIGAQPYVDKSNVTWATHQSYLDSRALVIPVNTITSTSPAFSYGPDAYGNSISFAPATATTAAKITIQGVVKVAGDLQVGEPKGLITYQGNGTMYASGNLNMDANILPASGKVFPTTARMGFIAGKDMNLSTGFGSAQIQMAGAFYAQGTMRSAKQNQILGTFVASFFDMGTNVPNIYQVPSLTKNMPPAMPGDERFFSLKVRTFRDRSPLPGQSDSFSGGNPYTSGSTGSTSGGGITIS